MDSQYLMLDEAYTWHQSYRASVAIGRFMAYLSSRTGRSQIEEYKSDVQQVIDQLRESDWTNRWAH